jgi:hypothetical protein
MLTCASGVAFLKLAQFGFGNDKLSNATVEANHKLGKNPHDGFVDIFQSRKVDGNFSPELLQVF